MNLDLVLRDLAVPGGVTPTAITQNPQFLILYGVDGSATAIDATLPLVELASRVQEWAVDDLSSRGLPADWPRCPRHAHRLAAASMGDRAVWRCPDTADEVAEIGSLPIPD